jgi:hypothetical protein
MEAVLRSHHPSVTSENVKESIKEYTTRARGYRRRLQLTAAFVLLLIAGTLLLPLYFPPLYPMFLAMPICWFFLWHVVSNSMAFGGERVRRGVGWAMTGMVVVLVVATSYNVKNVIADSSILNVDKLASSCWVLIVCSPSAFYLWRTFPGNVNDKSFMHNVFCTGTVGKAVICLATVAAQVVDDDLTWEQPTLAGLWAVVAITALPCFREFGATWFALPIEQVHAASAIASLMGNRDIPELMEIATARFRSIALDKVTLEAFVSAGGPVGKFHHLTDHASFGEVDAFISQSWHDSAEDRWLTLQKWRAQFVAKHKREPRVWLDKYCVDQGMVDIDLAMLPIFLAGCRSLVVLAGPTFLERMWCIVELFVFLEMGGNRVVLWLLPQTNETISVETQLPSFDAAECKCFSPDDRARLLACIEATCTSLSTFNGKVQISVVHCFVFMLRFIFCGFLGA